MSNWRVRDAPPREITLAGRLLGVAFALLAFCVGCSPQQSPPGDKKAEPTGQAEADPHQGPPDGESGQSEVRTKVHQWIKNPPPLDSPQYVTQIRELLDQYGARLVSAGLREAPNASSPVQRLELFHLVTLAATTFGAEPFGSLYQETLAAVGDAHRFRSYLGCRVLRHFAWQHSQKEPARRRLIKDFRKLARSRHFWTRAYAYDLCTEVEAHGPKLIEFLKQAANQDRSFPARYWAAAALYTVTGPTPELRRCFAGLFATVDKREPPFVPSGEAVSREALVRRLGAVLRTDPSRKVGVFCPLVLPHTPTEVDLRLYAVQIAIAWSLPELLPQIRPLVRADDPILQERAKRAVTRLEESP